MSQQHILVTGANGFVGRPLCNQLRQYSFQVTQVGRAPDSADGGAYCQVVSIDGTTDWSTILDEVEVVIHLAARVHVMQENLVDPIVAYWQTNVEGTLNLARQALNAGVKRFIFVSSIKVNGEQSFPGKPFTAEDMPMPEDAYGKSKWEAEQGLLALAKDSNMAVAIIRPPLVYGSGVKGNFSTMIKLLQTGLPLPFGAIANQRSLVAIGNLIDLIMVCINHPAAANQVFLVSDGEDLSTTALLRRLALAAGVSSRLIPFPAAWVNFVFSVLGKKMMAGRILGSLQVDISKTRELLDWQPPVTVDQGLRNCFPTKDEP